MSNEQNQTAEGGPLQRRVKPHALEIRNCSGEDSSTLMSKGHHDKAEFLKAAEAYWGEPLSGFDPPEHLWWRWVPARPGDDYKGYYHEAKPGDRGAFPCTAITQW